MESLSQFSRHSGAESVCPQQGVLYTASAGELLAQHE